jgi:hypothetical protein
VTLGEFTIQKVKDELYWIAPLLHSGFFKWNKNNQTDIGKRYNFSSFLKIN